MILTRSHIPQHPLEMPHLESHPGLTGRGRGHTARRTQGLIIFFFRRSNCEEGTATPGPFLQLLRSRRLVPNQREAAVLAKELTQAHSMFATKEALCVPPRIQEEPLIRKTEEIHWHTHK